MKKWQDIIKGLGHRDHKSRYLISESPQTSYQPAPPRPLQKVKPHRKKSRKLYYLGVKYPDVTLSEREAQCMLLMLNGHTFESAGKLLGISSRTVEFYINNMKMKLNCRSKVELIQKVSTTQFIDLLDFDVWTLLKQSNR